MQDGKNLVLAIVLCLLILIGWSALAERMGWISKPVPVDPAAVSQQAETPPPPPAHVSATTPDGSPLPAFTPAPGREVRVSTPLFDAVLHSGGGFVRSFVLKRYFQTAERNSPPFEMVNEATGRFAPMGVVVNRQPSWSNGAWSYDGPDAIQVEPGRPVTLSFTGEVDGLRLVRELTFDAGTYHIRERLRIRTTGDSSRSARLEFTAASDSRFASGSRYDLMRVAWDNDGSLAEETSEDKLAAVIKETGRIHWAGPMGNYFFMAVIPGSAENATMRAWTQEGIFRASVSPEEIIVEPGKEAVCETSYWIGPKERPLLLAVGEEVAKSVDLGFFSLIGKGLLWLLEHFHAWVGNWGVAIILLSALIKIVFWPLTAKSYASMEKMRRLKPQMDKIKERCGDDRQLLQKETMNLYKTYGVNPAGGCVPLLIQMPVFFGLYQALLASIELRHAPFIATVPGTELSWITDLSAADPYYVTPLIMGATMFIQQKFNPPASDPTQQKIMMALPFVFTLLFITFPSGLVIYWVVNNILSILQQWMMTRRQRLDR